MRHGKSQESLSRLLSGAEGGLVSPSTSAAAAHPATPASRGFGAGTGTGGGGGGSGVSSVAPGSAASNALSSSSSVAPSSLPPIGIDNPTFDLLDGEAWALHQDSRRWLLPNVTRDDAEHLLGHKSDGTFLIRRSKRGSAPYALSIVYKVTPSRHQNWFFFSKKNFQNGRSFQTRNQPESPFVSNRR